MLSIEVADHPLLELGILHALWPMSLDGFRSPPEVTALLALDAPAPLQRSDEVRSQVRNLLRHGGYKPTGRGKPAAEYLVRAATDGALSSINPAVDVCNVVSLHSGLPISVVDPTRLVGSARVAIAGVDSRYVFNTSGQEIRLDGLLCLFDAEGPCANAVKDSQRTKTSGASRETLSLIWGTHAVPGHTQAAVDWYAALLRQLGVRSVEAGLLAARR